MTSPVNVGTVSVEVVASAAGFAKKLRAAVAKEFKDAGLDKVLGDALGKRPVKVPVTPQFDEKSIPTTLPKQRKPPKLPVQVDPLMRAFQADVRKETAKLARSVVTKIPVTPNTARLRADLAAALERLQKATKIQVPTEPGKKREYEAKLRAMLRDVQARVSAAVPAELPKPVKVRVDVDRRSMADLAKRLSGFLSGAAGVAAKTGGIVLLAGTAATALAGLTSAASAAVPVLLSVGAAAATAAGSLVIVPGALAAAGAAAATLRLGMIGLEDAFKAVAKGDAEALKEALEGLAPNARKFVKELARLRPAFDKLRLKVQQNLFANTDKTLRALAKSTLPTLTRGMTVLAATINRQVIGAVRELNTASFRSTLAAVLAAASVSASNLGAALAPVGRALLDVVRVGADLTAELSGGVAEALTGVAERISEMAQSGELRQMFDDGLAALRAFGGLARDVLGVLGGIARAFGADSEGGGMFAFFDRLNEAINSIEGQAALTDLFQALGDIGQALTPVLVAVGQALVPVAQGIADVAVAFAPGLAAVAQALGAALGGLAPAAVALAPALAAIAAGLIPLGQIITDLIVGAAPGFTALIGGLAEGLAALAPAAGPVGRALGDIGKALAPLLPLIGVQLANGLTVIAGLARSVAAAFGPLIAVWGDAMAGAMAELTPALTALATAVLPVLAQAGRQLADAFRPLVPVFVEIGRQMAGAIMAALPPLVRAFQQLLPVVAQVAPIMGQALLSALVAIAPLLPELARAGLGLAQALLELLVAVAPILVPAAKFSAALLALAVRSGSLTFAAKLLTAAMFVVMSAVQSVTDVVRRILSPLSAARGSFSGFGSAASGAARTALQVFASLPGRIRGAVGSLSGLLVQAGRNAVQGLINGIRSRMPSLSSVASSMAGTIRNFLPFSPAKEGPLSGRGNPYYSGRSIVDLLSRGVTANLGTAGDAASNLAAQFAVQATPGLAGGALAAATPAPSGLRAEWVGGTGDPIIAALRDHIRIYYGGSPTVALGAR